MSTINKFNTLPTNTTPFNSGDIAITSDGKGYALSNAKTWVSIFGAGLPVTQQEKDNWNDAFNKRHTHANKDALDMITIPSIDEWDTAYSMRHSHTNKAILDAITAQNISDWNSAIRFLGNLDPAQSLNNYTTAGYYTQANNSGATIANNYPDTYAGVLIVYGTGGHIVQEYTTYSTRNDKYRRYLYAGTWSVWTKSWDSNDFPQTTIDNWNTAYGWGNHALAGYLTQGTGDARYLKLTGGDLTGNVTTTGNIQYNSATSVFNTMASGWNITNKSNNQVLSMDFISDNIMGIRNGTSHILTKDISSDIIQVGNTTTPSTLRLKFKNTGTPTDTLVLDGNGSLSRISGLPLTTAYLTSKTATDLNTLTTEGIMFNYINGTTANRPVGFTNGNVMTLNVNAGASSQLLFGITEADPSVYFRQRINSTYGLYYRLATMNDLTSLGNNFITKDQNALPANSLWNVTKGTSGVGVIGNTSNIGLFQSTSQAYINAGVFYLIGAGLNVEGASTFQDEATFQNQTYFNFHSKWNDSSLTIHRATADNGIIWEGATGNIETFLTHTNNRLSVKQSESNKNGFVVVEDDKPIIHRGTYTGDGQIDASTVGSHGLASNVAGGVSGAMVSFGGNASNNTGQAQIIGTTGNIFKSRAQNGAVWGGWKSLINIQDLSFTNDTTNNKLKLAFDGIEKSVDIPSQMFTAKTYNNSFQAPFTGIGYIDFEFPSDFVGEIIVTAIGRWSGANNTGSIKTVVNVGANQNNIYAQSANVIFASGILPNLIAINLTTPCYYDTVAKKASLRVWCIDSTMVATSPVTIFIEAKSNSTSSNPFFKSLNDVTMKPFVADTTNQPVVGDVNQTTNGVTFNHIAIRSTSQSGVQSGIKFPSANLTSLSNTNGVRLVGSSDPTEGRLYLGNGNNYIGVLSGTSALVYNGSPVMTREWAIANGVIFSEGNARGTINAVSSDLGLPANSFKPIKSGFYRPNNENGWGALTIAVAHPQRIDGGFMGAIALDYSGANAWLTGNDSTGTKLPSKRIQLEDETHYTNDIRSRSLTTTNRSFISATGTSLTLGNSTIPTTDIYGTAISLNGNTSIVGANNLTLGTGNILTTNYGSASQWFQAFGWGNHATAGYVTSAQLGNYVSKAGDLLTGSLTWDGRASGVVPSIVRDLSMNSNAGGIAREFLSIKGANGVQDVLGHLGNVDSSGNFNMAYGFVGGASYNGLKSLIWTNDGRVGIGMSGTSNVPAGTSLYINGETRIAGANGNLSLSGSINKTSGTGELLLQVAGVNRFRSGSINTVASASSTASTNGFFIRPSDDGTATDETLFSKDVVKFSTKNKFFDKINGVSKYTNVKSLVGVASQEGNVRITFPSNMSTTMWSMKVRLIQYVGSNSNTKGNQLPMEVTVTNYNSTPTGANANFGARAINVHSNFVGVRIGVDSAGNRVLWLDLSSATSYSKVIIDELILHHSGSSSATNDGDYKIEFATDDTGFTTGTTILLNDFKELVTEAKIANWDTAFANSNNSPRRAVTPAQPNSILVSDNRSTNPIPTTDLQFGTFFDFKQNSSIGINSGASFSGVITVVPYNADSGNNNSAFRIAQSNNNLYFQNYNAGSWRTWNRIWTSNDFQQATIDNWNTAYGWGNHANAGYLTNATGDSRYVLKSQMGVANGVATLDANGFVPSAQLPSYVDDVLEFSSLSAFPTTGESGKIYIATDTNMQYRWTGTQYVSISSGAVQSVNGMTGVVTLNKTHVGLGNVDNTADSTKNVLSATKLTTARTLKIGNTGKTFNGTGDVTWTLAEIGAVAPSDITNFVRKTGDTMSDELVIRANGKPMTLSSVAKTQNYLAWLMYDNSKAIGYIGANGGSAVGDGGAGDKFVIRGTTGLDLYTDSGNVTVNGGGVWTTNHFENQDLQNFFSAYNENIVSGSMNATNLILSNRVNGGITIPIPQFNQNTTGNSGTATKLQTARTIKIGEQSGTFDGTGNLVYSHNEMKVSMCGVKTHGESWNSVVVLDTRNADPLPSTQVAQAVTFDFKQSSAIGFNSISGVTTYASALTFAPFINDSGNNGSAYMLAHSGGVMGFRDYYNGVWGSWNKLWSSKDFSSTQIVNWNVAYGWGNHANAGYLKQADLANYLTKTDTQFISGMKIFSALGNNYDNSIIRVEGNGSTIYPTIGFHQPGIVGATLSVRNDMNLYYNNSKILTETSLNNLVTTDTQQTITGNKIFKAGCTFPWAFFTNDNGSGIACSIASQSIGDEAGLIGGDDDYIAVREYVQNLYIFGAQAIYAGLWGSGTGGSVGHVGIRTTPHPTLPLWINGNAGTNGTMTAVGFYESSRRDLKTNIKPFEKSGLDLVNELDIVTFDRIDAEDVKDKIGIIIDDTPEEFASVSGDEVDLYKTTFIQAKAIQELSKTVADQSREIEELKKMVNILLNNKNE